MADTKLPSYNSFKDQFDDQLTCTMCLEQYTDPKTLPCLHSFCLQCIELLPVEMKQGQHYISCPTCCIQHLLPEGGIVNLPNAFHINSLIALRKQLNASEMNQRTMQSSKATTCREHNDLLTVYCETCRQVICRDCTISEKHSTHNFYLISECYPKHHQQLQDSLDLVKHKTDDIDTAITDLATREREVLQQGQQLKEQINTHAQQIIVQVQRSRTRLSQQVNAIVQQKTKVLTAQKQQAQKIRTQLKICQDKIEHSLKEWNQLQILTKKHTVMDDKTQNVDPTLFKPIEKPDIQFIKRETIEKEIGLITGTTLGNTTLKALTSLAKQQSEAILTLQSHDGSPFSLPPSLIFSTLISPVDQHIVKCNITQTHPGIYNITFTPTTKGAHMLTVQVGGVEILDSPFTLPVIPSPEMRGQCMNAIHVPGLSRPYSVAVHENGDMVVAEVGTHCITTLNKTQLKVGSFGTKGTNEGQFSYPRGVAIAEDKHILVTDHHRLQKLTTNGVCVKSVGSSNKGSGPLEFDTPGGIAVHPTTGQIFVADCGNNRIQVFTKDLTLSLSITHRKLKWPCDVALDSEGYLYTTDSGNHCVTKLTTTGQYIKKIASLNKGTPNISFLAIHNNLVYVSECSTDQVTILDTNGKLLHAFGKENEFNGLRGIVIDTLGSLYACDIVNDRIIVC